MPTYQVLSEDRGILVEIKDNARNEKLNIFVDVTFYSPLPLERGRG
jgi:hypothetical protein